MSSMDGEAVNSGELASACLEHSDEKDTDSETKSLEGDLEQLYINDDDFEQPDGQRSSLSLDDDGGTHFDVHSQDGLVRRVRETIVSPTLQDDNDIMFNPLQRLNFDDDFGDQDEDDNCERRVDDNGIDDCIETSGHVLDNDSLEDRDYLHHRPAVHGSDLSEQGAFGGIVLSHDQGQNIRIIEGHDSSLLDDGGNSSPYGFNFLHTQMIQIPIVSSVNSNLANSSRLEEDSHNLYDSLEREDGSNHYGNSMEANGHVLENNTSEYFSSGSMNLMATSSQGPDTDLLWAQDESSENGNYLTHTQQHYQHSSEQQSPPRNFQVDPTGIFVAKRPGNGFLNEANLGSFGDSHTNEEDNTDALSIELSEEGLLQNAQTYAQPISSVATASGTLHHLQAQKDWNLWPQSNSIVQANGFDIPDTSRAFSLPPKNLARAQGSCNIEINSEGDGADNQDQRQAAAGSSSSASDQNHSAADQGKAPKKSVNSKVQPRRPAVQGSASSGDTRKPLQVTQRPNLQSSSTACKKSSSYIKSGNSGEKVLKGKADVLDMKNRHDSAKVASNGLPSHSSNPSSRPASSNLLAATTNNSVGSTQSTNSRVSGVGKESHMASSYVRAANQLSSVADNNFVSTLSHRGEDSGHGDLSSSSSSLSQLSNPANSGLQHPQMSQSFDRIKSSGGQSQLELRASQSFNKPKCAPGSANVLAQNLSLVSDHNVESNLHHLPPRPGETRRAATSTGLQGSYQRGNSQQRYPGSPQHAPYFGSTIQRTHLGFPFQAPINQRENAGLENIPSQSRTITEGYNKSGQVSANQHAHIDNDIQGMEEVRSQLLNVLFLGADATSASVADHASFDQSDNMSEIMSSEQHVKRHLHFDTDISSYMGNPQDAMSDILENFPTFSSKIFLEMSGVSNKPETSVHGENQYLRDSLEKEKYRRKHCEEHIQKLNAKLLEVQQQLAVAVSTDKRKDLMIEQLDRQLAKVVEGWKKRELEKDEFLRVLSHEKAEIEETLQSQQNMINSFERELAQTVEQLKAEKDHSNQKINVLKEELKESLHEKEHAKEVLESERQKFAGILAEWQELRESRDEAEKIAQETQEKLLAEQELLSKKEQEFVAKIAEVKEANQKVINMEKIKLEEQKNKLEEVVQERDELKSELKKAALDLEQLIRDKESQKVEMAILEAKFETAQRKLEADLHSQMEKEIAEQASEFHSRIETALDEAAERHRKQVSELQSQHQRDLERHTAMMNEDRLKREDEHRKQLGDLEEKLQVLRTENHNLRQSKIKLESQRVEILAKLQFMMQSQWNEAVSLLVSTPQKRSLNGSFISSQAGSGHSGQLGAVLAVSDNSTSITSNFNLATSMPPSSIVQGVESRAESTLPLPETQLAKCVSENDSKDRGEELNRMNRVEEYLQQLNHHMDIPMTKNDLQVSDVSPSPDQRSGNSSTSTSGRVTHSFSMTSSDQPHGHMQQHKELGSSVLEFSSSVGYLERDPEYLSKPSNNLNQSHLPRVHGYVSGQSGKTLITTVGPITSNPQSMQEFTYQALPMRSPQQSSSRFNLGLDLSNESLRSDTGASLPFTATSNQPFTPPRHHHSYSYQQQHECLKQQASAAAPCPSHAGGFPSGYPEGRQQHAGDFGDQRNLKMTSSAAGDKNLYSPDSPSFIHTDPWSPGNAASARPFFANNAGATIRQSPKGSQMVRSIEGMESPVKRYKPRAGQQTSRTTGSLNDSLSPPVKQTADRLHCDIMSDADDSQHDPDRMQTNYSQILESFEDQQSRQNELQHYVRMLLQKAPGSVYSEPERDIHFDHDVLESSRDITVDLDMNETATALELTSQLTRFQQLRDGQIFEPHSDRLVQDHENGQTQDILGHMNDFIGQNGVISSQGLSEISQLLSMYRDQWETHPAAPGQQAAMASQLMHVLKDMAAGNSDNLESSSETKMQTGKSQNTVRKVRQMTKTKKVRIASQSTDTSFTSERTHAPVKSANPVTASKKVALVQVELGKDKKVAPPKPMGPKGGPGSTGGTAWK